MNLRITTPGQISYGPDTGNRGNRRAREQRGGRIGNSRWTPPPRSLPGKKGR